MVAFTQETVQKIILYSKALRKERRKEGKERGEERRGEGKRGS